MSQAGSATRAPDPGGSPDLTPPDAGGSDPALTRRQVRAVAVVVVTAAAVGTVGAVIRDSGVHLHLIGGVLIRGPWVVDLTPWVALPVLLAVAVVTTGPGLAARLPWTALLAGSTALSAAWSVTLALARYGPTTPDGSPSLGAPLESGPEYLHDIPRVHGLVSLLAEYTTHVPADSAEPWTTHVSGHPPGPLALFAGLEAIGLGGSGWAAAVCIAAGAATVPAVLVAVRTLHGPTAARSLAPYLVLAPWALWVATSADTLWTATSAWGIALLALAVDRERGGRASAQLVGAGLLLGLSAFGSYGIAPLALVALAVLRWRGRLRGVGWVAAGAVVPVGLAGLAGFWWWDGLVVAAQRVADGPASIDRPYAYFVVANLAIAALALGPAVVAGLSTRPRTAGRDLPLAAAATAAVVLTDLTGLAKGEVERIWLPYYPWVTVAVLLLVRRQDRRWLAAQAALAIVIQVFIRTEW